jgi:hypothetical protein
MKISRICLIMDNKLGDIMIADNIDWRICKKKMK